MNLCGANVAGLCHDLGNGDTHRGTQVECLGRGHQRTHGAGPAYVRRARSRELEREAGGQVDPEPKGRDDIVQVFLVGVAGAFVGYCALYRENRFLNFLECPSGQWRVLVFDLVVFLGCGGLVAAFFINAHSTREAALAGASWQAIVGGVVAGKELQVAKAVDEGRRSNPPDGGLTREASTEEAQ